MITLDEAQQRVVDVRDGKVLVSSGAGSGKSTTLIERVVDLVAEGVSPHRILTVTFNRDAADSFSAKLRTRLTEEGFVQRGFPSPVTDTFHAFAYRCLRESLLGDPEWAKMSLAMSGAEFSLAQTAFKLAGMKAMDAKPYLAASTLLRETLIPLEDEKTAVKAAMRLEPFHNDRETATSVVRFSMAFQQAKANENKFDFGDMIFLFNHFVKNDPAFATWIAGMYDHVQVDEAQDLSEARWVVTSAAAKSAKSIVLVGDLRQSINSFAGSDLNIIRRLYREEGYRLLLLPTNRRSVKSIVDFGNKISRGRDWHLGGDAKALPNAEEGADIAIWGTATPEEEANKIAEEISAMYLAEGSPVRDRPTVFVLSRTNAALADVEAKLREAHVPIRVRAMQGGLWTTAFGKAILAYLAAGEKLFNDDTFLAANRPLRYVRKEDIRSAISQAKYGGSFSDTLRKIRSPGCQRFADDLDLLLQQPYEQRVNLIMQWLHKDCEDRKKQDLDAISQDDDKKQLVTRLCAEAKTAGSYAKLVQATRSIRVGESKPYVELSSVHRVKGDEADVVYLIGVREKHLPFVKATTTEAIDEERRIFYVAATRARELFTISTGGVPSSFLVELGIAPIVKRKPAVEPVASSPASSEVIVRKKGRIIDTDDIDSARAKAKADDCPRCDGTGESKTDPRKRCPLCKGSGESARLRVGG